MCDACACCESVERVYFACVCVRACEFAGVCGLVCFARVCVSAFVLARV